MIISDKIKYVGVNDHEIDLFEGQYDVPNGMSYNSYIILGEKIAVLDSVDVRFKDEWLDNIKSVIGDRSPDYIIIQHMEPDHSSSLTAFMAKYPTATVVSSDKSFVMMKQFFKDSFDDRRIGIKEGDVLSLGDRELTFIGAPMVHWPEVIMTIDKTDKVLFSADGFGKFGALDVEDEWACEARRYYFGIVGKYGLQVQNVLKKLANVQVETICPLHGPVLNENLEYYLNLYNVWSSYGVETDGVAIFYTSVYGNTKKAVEKLVEKLKELNCPKIALNDLARSDMAECVEDAFRYGKIVLATTTYNGDIFPFMREFVNELLERGYKNRLIGLIENGTWAPVCARHIKKSFETSKNIQFTENIVTLHSALSNENEIQIENLAKELLK